jgi:hypothetical protein
MICVWRSKDGEREREDGPGEKENTGRQDRKQKKPDVRM